MGNALSKTTRCRCFKVAIRLVLLAASLMTFAADLQAESSESHYPYNRAPLASTPYAELPLGTIQAQGWLKQQLECMAGGMSGRLDELYPQVVGARNGWLGGGW